jgi:TusA-related sulfurtransferase
MLANKDLFIQSSDVLEEGLVRGLVTMPKRMFDETINNFIALTKVPANKDNKIKYIKQELKKIKDKFTKHDLNLKDDANLFIVRKLTNLFRWRHYVILSDKRFNEAIDNIKKGGKVGIWIDTKISQRDIPELFNIKTKEDIIKIIDKYEKRIDEIEKYMRKDPDKFEAYNNLLHWGIFGLRDLFSTISAIIHYGSKGL